MALKFPLHNLRQRIDGQWQQVNVTETITVPTTATDGYYIVHLEEVPDNGQVNGRVTVNGLTETTTYPPVAGSFYVNYAMGRLAFASTESGQTLSAGYYKKGSLVEVEDINWLYEQVSQNFQNNYVIAATPPLSGERFEGQVWYNTTNNVTYTFDGTRDKWISNNRETLVFGRQENSQNQYLNYYGSKIASNLSGLKMLRDGCITGISVQLDAVGTCTFQIRKNNVPVSIGNIIVNNSFGTSDETLNIDTLKDDFIQIYLESSGVIETPIIMIEIAWRQ